MLSSEARTLLAETANLIEADPAGMDMMDWHRCVAGRIIAVGDPGFLEDSECVRPGYAIEARAMQLLGLPQRETCRLFYMRRWPVRYEKKVLRIGAPTESILLVKDGRSCEAGSPGYASVVTDRIRFFAATDGTDDETLINQPVLVEEKEYALA